MGRSLRRVGSLPRSVPIGIAICLLSMTAKDKLRYQWGHSWADFPLSSSSSEKKEKSPRFFFRGHSFREKEPCSWVTQNHFLTIYFPKGLKYSCSLIKLSYF